MNITFTSLPNEFQVGFEIHIKHEHGDADFYTYSTYFKNMSKEELVEYINSFNSLAKAIYKNRSYGTSLPKDILDELNNRDVISVGRNFIEPVFDKTANQSNYYAYPSIEKIVYTSETGEKSIVTYH